tara:strand:+ start:130 stop:375 length:246 start_codon:yes stop_codon:yes gene_type:complete
MEFKFIADPGHAWLKVEKSIAKQVGYAPTTFDYEDSKHYYFEEDCSAFDFIKKYEAHYQYRAEFADTKYQENFRETVRSCA